MTHPDTGERMTLVDLARETFQVFQPLALKTALDDAGVVREMRPYRWWALYGA